MTIRIGANPIGWSQRRSQEIGGDTPLETCLAEAKEAGFDGMEKGHKMPNDGAALKAKLAEFGMVFVGGWYSTELLRRSAKEEFEAAQGAYRDDQGRRRDVLIAAETSNTIHGDRAKPLVRAPAAGQGRLGRLRRENDRIRRASRRRGAQALLPPPHGHDRPVGARHRRLHGAHQAAGASAARHRTRALGRRPTRRASRAPIATRIGHVHCKDVREAKMREANAGDWSFLDSILGMGKELGVYTAPGDGMIDYAAVFKELKGYSGWVVLEAEQDPKKAPALPYAKKGVAHIRGALKEAGLTL